LEPTESLTAAVYNPNGVNFAIGSSLGCIYFGSVKPDTQGKIKVTVGKMDSFVRYQNAVTSLQFSSFDPIGSFLCAFDNGTVKTWQSSIKNE
jgi:hypothetical protein